MENIETDEGFNYLKIIFKSLVISIIISILLLVILSILISTTNLSESIIKPSVIIISSFSILFGSFILSKKIKKKGIIYGSLLGFLYMSILYLISSTINFNFSIDLDSLVMIGTGILGGALGGIIGVNL